jgi:mono/diheme cytochrome c family protein
LQENRLRPRSFRVTRWAAALSVGTLLLELPVAGRGASTPRSFAAEVAPLFARYCVECHGPGKSHASLRLDSYEGVLRGGDAGPAVVAADPEESLLVAKIERRDRPAMPPRRRLPKAAVASIREWIASGAAP